MNDITIAHKQKTFRPIVQQSNAKSARIEPENAQRTHSQPVFIFYSTQNTNTIHGWLLPTATFKWTRKALNGFI